MNNAWDYLSDIADARCKLMLSPVVEEDIPKIWVLAADQSIWRYTFRKPVTYRDFEQIMKDAINANVNMTEKVYSIRLLDGTIVGGTRIKKISRQHLRVEIGDTWLGMAWHRTFVNTHAKLLILTHAFEVMECIRVEFKTDMMNLQSRNALIRLGAKEEGVFRQHMILPSGQYRDTVYFSIISSEWPIIKKKLVGLINN